MQVSFEKLDGLKRQIIATMPADQVEALRDTEAKKLAKQVRLEGFRPGKAPAKMVKKMYKADINGRILDDAFRKAFEQASADNEFRMAGQPSVEDLKMENKEPMEFTAVFEVYPEITPVDIDGVELELISSEVTDENLDEMIERLRKQHADFNESEEAAEKGDRVTIDFVGKIDGEEFEGGSGEDMAIEVGGGQMLAEFDAALDGIKKSEEKEAEVNFPEDYPAEQLQGKTAVFTITAKKVEKPDLPELNDEFAKKFNVDTFEAFKKDLIDNMNRELGDRVSNKNKQTVLDAWLEANTFDVPTALVEQEVESLAKEMNVGEPAQGTDAEQHKKMIMTLFEERAKKRVALGLLMGAYLNQNEIKVDQDKLEARLETLSASYQDPEEVKQHYKTDPQANSSLQALVLEEQVVELVKAKATVTEVEKPFSDIMNEQGNRA